MRIGCPLATRQAKESIGLIVSLGKYCKWWVHFCVAYSYVKDCVLTD